MSPIEKSTPPTAGPHEAVSRRDFLRVGSLSVMGLSVADPAVLKRAADAKSSRSCIFVLMTGGASQLDTFDPKPDAPSEIRGPSRAISTAQAGVQFSESLPRLAARISQFAVVRSLTHGAAPVHEGSLQLLQTGWLPRNRVRFPSFGSAIAAGLGRRRGAPASVVVGEPLRATGLGGPTGQSAGLLGMDFEPVYDGVAATAGELHAAAIPGEPDGIRRLYGDTVFGRRCLRARQLVEKGVRCVTVNLFDTLEGRATWDCHGRPSAPATLYDYRDSLVPSFDQAVSGLIDDLCQRGLYGSTLVIAAGEFGRTPRINESAGRDHWPGAWSALVGGCGVQGGRVIGASDARGGEPIERPVHPGELVATIYDRFGLDATATYAIDEKTTVPLIEHSPIHELF